MTRARSKAIPPTAGERKRISVLGQGILREENKTLPISLVFTRHPSGQIGGGAGPVGHAGAGDLLLPLDTLWYIQWDPFYPEPRSVMADFILDDDW